jgi:hypothetical protein
MSGPTSRRGRVVRPIPTVQAADDERVSEVDGVRPSCRSTEAIGGGGDAMVRFHRVNGR